MYIYDINCVCYKALNINIIADFICISHADAMYMMLSLWVNRIVYPLLYINNYMVTN